MHYRDPDLELVNKKGINMNSDLTYTTLLRASLHQPLEKLARVSVEMAASDTIIRPVFDIVKEVKEQGSGTEVKYNNLKVRRLLEEAAENFMLGLATVDKSVLEWLADDCTMIGPSLDEKTYPTYVVLTMNSFSEIDPVQDAIDFWCSDDNEEWFKEILRAHLKPLIDNINAGGLHSSWGWFTHDATLTTSINLPRYEGTTFERREAVNDYLASQYNAEPRMKFVPLLFTYGQGHMACHAWYRVDDEHGLSSPRDHQLLITANFNNYHRLVSMEFSEYTVAGPASYIEMVDNCVACRAMTSMTRERQMEEDADDSTDDEAYSEWPHRNEDHDH
ncbi:uncharacterized protein BDZ83DRAFT_732434 [Colletotrichum acutatum]|uniref:Uncharacterized protein n=1 Tax=Glomerella acutata TaxID=27357 RepID=A0AAD8XCK4_GLOAC|nr:uncharacterized protein BDZ83DRAFT_732434 [Colletotrichum acutatum]KAK1722744.1 hypothetical protein BDZ83DRAFT_732434 [Colletotrichum acutatum]